MEVWNNIQQAEEFGANVSDATLNWTRVIERKNTIINKFTSGKEPKLKKLGVEFVRGHAKFASPTSIKVGDSEYYGERFLIGTGSKPSTPAIKGIEHAVTSKEILNLTSLPSSIAILGGGVISLEFAYILASAGVNVTIVLRGNTLLKTMDNETSELVLNMTKERGIEVKTNVHTESVLKHGDGHYTLIGQVDGKTLELETEIVMNATGRTPQVDGLGLENAGVRYSDKGIHVNEYFETTASGIYAAGDVIGGLMLTPIATYEAKLAIRNAIRGNKEKADYTLVPHAIFTMPPIANIGLSEEAAKEKGIEYKVYKSYLKHSAVAIILGEEAGYIKILTDKETGQIIGFHMVGIHADEIVHSMAIAMKAKFTIHDLAEIINVHPTISETLMLMAGK
ncbi:pyruvate/2-oxoglutarate dehydrogenase complex dihydrolipoamide dehydrogenase (E3) component [Bacillus mesophilus]|uniref:NAD(P)/FAD-dependent oxidoreductase n=2 Tax=Bacillus mesophilus TaxID=1808955 RepID=A0A6M0Q928_9BACI|nr:pyruvate/2-oxoglutarate dehydrogenase complex dihydrolipoamide dehydrogenase (E3) component [Bacillus mesophilus]NEY72793.1 NAD(P)/FAD-dependent oxidoreductase [Bacillus mesophilus]